MVEEEFLWKAGRPQTPGRDRPEDKTRIIEMLSCATPRLKIAGRSVSDNDVLTKLWVLSRLVLLTIIRACPSSKNSYMFITVRDDNYLYIIFPPSRCKDN